ncbi:MAG: co-chaperone GroES [Patescibacteria group bacterium]|nr:co-chaperone GroES [Patescibacteria group bacterium]
MNISRLVSLHDRVILRVFPPEYRIRISAPGYRIQNSIFISSQAGMNLVQAEVVAVGNGRLADNGILHPLSVGVGDIVLIHPESGSEFQNEHGTFRTLREEEIVAIVGE